MGRCAVQPTRPNRRRAMLAAFIAGIAGVTFSSRAESQSFSRFVGFGDSTIDSGWYKNAAPNSVNPIFNADFAIAVTQGAGAATTSPGLVSSQYLAAFFGLSANPANQPGGSNYATGGARDAQFNVGTGNQGAVPTVTQIGVYLAANNGIANSNTLYLISSGGNDIIYATGNLPAAAQSAYVTTAATALVSAIVSLAQAGARYILVPNQPQSFGDPTTRALNASYNNTLWSGLAAAQVNFIPVDVNAMYRAVTSNFAEFGLIAGAGPACTQPAGVPSGWASLCSTNSSISTLVSSNAAQTHLFADDLHLATAGQIILADYEYSLIVAPSEISLLAEAPVKTREAVVNSIVDQLRISQRQRSVGSYNAWVTGDIAALKMSSAFNGFPGDPGVPISGTVGVDYAFAAGWLVGGALSVGTTTQTFNLGGNFQQNEVAVSAFTAYSGGPVWADIIGSFGALNDSVNRSVPIGITQQSNTGQTFGTNTSLALEGGYNFRAGPFSHGPLAGMLLQHVYIGGYTETDAFSAIGGFTALSFSAQNRNSAVTELGYQVAVDVGAWQPFAQLWWNHELAPTDRLVTAALTSTTAPSFAMPAVVLGSDWATANVGVSVAIGHGMTAYAMFTSEIAQAQTTYYGGEIGLNVALNTWLQPVTTR
jgi:outer membrane lipase/esterase